MTNAPVKKGTMQKALSNPAFKSGFMDWAFAKGWNEQWDRRRQWDYERGRLFALWLSMRGIDPKRFKLKAGRWASRETIHHFRCALSEGAVF